MSPAEYAKQRRDRARAAGLCVQCCVRPRMESRSRCPRCYEIHSQRRPIDAEAHRKRREQAAQEGRCYTCCVREAAPGRQNCEGCGNGGKRRARAGEPPPEWCDECIASGFHREGCAKQRRAA